MKTYAPKPRDIERRWYVMDAEGQVLGRLASEAAAVLRGKHKPIFAPHMDTGDHVIVVNAKGIELTGGKRDTKVAYRHSGYPGGLTETRYSRLLEEKPAFAVEKAIKGMLPKNRLGRAMGRKLHVYAGPTHRHEAQQPKPLKLGEVPPWEGLPTPEVAAPKVRSDDAEATAKRSTARSTTAKRSTATTKESAATKSTAKRSTAKASTATKSTGKKTTAKKSTAKRSTARRTQKED
jgi:large subunit ribosomal protein L13